MNIYNECSLSNKRSDWSVVNNEGNSISIQPMSFGWDFVLVWFSFLLFFFVFCLFGVFYLFFFWGGVVFGFLPFFLYFGRRIISAWGNPWYFLVCLMIQKVLDVVFWWIVLLRISVLFEQFLVTAERVNCIRKLNPFNLFFYIL